MHAVRARDNKAADGCRNNPNDIPPCVPRSPKGRNGLKNVAPAPSTTSEDTRQLAHAELAGPHTAPNNNIDSPPHRTRKSTTSPGQRLAKANTKIKVHRASNATIQATCKASTPVLLPTNSASLWRPLGRRPRRNATQINVDLPLALRRGAEELEAANRPWHEL